MSKKLLIIICILFSLYIIGTLLKIIIFNENYTLGRTNRFITMQNFNAPGETSIIIDSETKVMYLWHSESYKGGLTVMFDANGKPLLYNKEEN